MRGARQAAVVLALGACAQVPPTQTPTQVLAASTTRDSAFDKTRTVSTPTIVSKHQRGGGLYVFTDTARTTLSVSQSKDTGTVIFLLTTTVEYSGQWRIYRTAILLRGMTLLERATFRAPVARPTDRVTPPGATRPPGRRRTPAHSDPQTPCRSEPTVKSLFVSNLLQLPGIADQL